jgi:hypothetical protein
MDLLPDDLKLKIFQELDAVHLCRLSVVSKSTKCLTDLPESWKIVHGNLKHEVKETHVKNAENLCIATCNFERCKDEHAAATSAALDAAAKMTAVEKRTSLRFKDNMDVRTWNTYNSAVSDLNFTEDRLDEAEKNLEDAELELWEVTGIVKADCKKLRVPLRLRKIADDALEVWKNECKKKIPCVESEAERRAWWIARYAFRAINKWEGKSSAPDFLLNVTAK